MAYSTVNWAYREVISSAKLQQMSDNDASLKSRLDAIDAGWAPWSVGLGGAFTLGNGSLTGLQQVVGKTIDFRLTLVFGSTTVLSGSASFSLPAGRAAGSGGPLEVVGHVAMFDNSASLRRFGFAAITAAGAATSLYNPDGSNVTATAPFTWASGDTLVVTGRYERT